MSDPRNLRHLRILFICEYFRPHWTGISQSSFYWAEDLAERNTVHVLTTQYDKSLPSQEKMGKLEIFRTPYLFRLTRSYYSASSLLKFWRMRHDYDYFIIACPHINIFPFALILRLLRKKFCIFHHGDLIFPAKGKKWDLKKFIMEAAFDLMTLPSMAFATHVANYTQDYAKHSRVLKRFLYKFAPVIPALPRPVPPQDPELIQKLANLRRQHVLIGFAGRFVEEKGFDILFRSLPWILQQMPEARLVFAGETHMGYESFFADNLPLIKKHEHHVEFLGRLPHEAMWDFYRGIDVFVVPSRSDCFNYTQVEAARSKTPCVVTDIPGARALIKHSHFGEIVPPEDPEGLARGIVRAAKNRATYLEYWPKIEEFLSPLQEPP